MAREKKSQPQEKRSTVEPTGEVLIPAPLVLETARTAAQAAPVLLGLAVFGLSLAQGASVMAAGMRAGAALFAAGLLGWLFTLLLARAAMDALVSLRGNTSNQAPTASTQEWEA